MVKAHRVVDHIVGYLAAHGISHIFGVDGANIEDLYDAAYFVTTSPQCWPSTNSPLPQWPTATAAAARGSAWWRRPPAAAA